MCFGASESMMAMADKLKTLSEKKINKKQPGDKSKQHAAGETDSCIHSANNELSVSQEWPVTHTTRPNNVRASSFQELANTPGPNGFSLAISEYVSVNREATVASSLSSKAIKYLHKRRLEERGYRMTNKKLGEGGFGAVYKVYHKDHSTPLACKIMILSKESKPKKDRNSMLQAFSNEVFVMKSCPHPNIVAIRQDFIYSHGPSTEDIRMVHSYIIMEYASLGTLYSKLKKTGPFGEVATHDYFCQLSSALAHLHRRGIAHRDLKLGNILLTSDRKGRESVKLTDFGLSRLVHSAQSGMTRFSKPAGTLSYMAPELIAVYVQYNSGQKDRIRPYDCFSVDMWALGVCLYLMLCKVHPFESPPSDKAERVEFARGMLVKQRSRNFRIPDEIRLSTSEAALHLVDALMEPKYRRRLNIYGVLQHSWLLTTPVPISKTQSEAVVPSGTSLNLQS